jgi:hypothetical protein
MRPRGARCLVQKGGGEADMAALPHPCALALRTLPDNIVQAPATLTARASDHPPLDKFRALLHCAHACSEWCRVERADPCLSGAR